MFLKEIFPCYRFGIQWKQLFSALMMASLVPALAHARRNAVDGLQDVSPLELGKSKLRELAGSQEHVYQISLSKNQYANIVVDQRGIDVVVQLLGADNKAIADFDYEITNQGQERVEVVAETPCDYRLVVKAKYPRLPAGRYEIKVAEIRTAVEKDCWLFEARRLEGASRRLWGVGKYNDALPPGEKALELQERVWGTAHPELSYALLNLAAVSYYKGDYAKSVSLCERGLMNAENALGPEHPLVSRLAFNLAVFYSTQTENALRAEELHKRALHIEEKVLGRDHPLVASSLAELAFISRRRGDFVNAEQLLQRALAVQERVFGEEDEAVATTLNYLAAVYREKGDYGSAEPAYKRSLEIREKTNHPYLVVALNNLANLYNDMGEYDKAEPLYQRSIALREKTVGSDHPQVANSRGALALLYSRRGDYGKAEPLYKSALATLEKTVGPNNQLVGELLVGLAELYYATGNFAKAEPLYKRALTIYETAYGTTNPYIANILVDLAELSAATENLGPAVAFQARANAIIEHNLDLNLAAGSERQKLAYLATLPKQMQQSISLHLRSSGDDPQARDLAATAVLQRKGRVLDAMSASFASLRQRSTAEEKTLISQYDDTTAQLARLILNGPQRQSPEEYQKKVSELEKRRESLESDIGRRSAEFHANSQPVTLASIKSAVPENSALIEFAIYRPAPPKADNNKPHKEFHYVAYVVRQNSSVGWRDLGDAESIDKAVGSLRQALRDPLRRDVREIARSLDERIMRPIRALVGEATRLLVSPDGALNLIPFEALVDERGQYLIQRYSFAYLTSGRDLLRMRVARESRSQPVVVADPDFGQPATVVAQAEVGRTPDQNSKVQFDRSQVFFGPLPGVAAEVRALKGLLPQATFLTRERATKAALKQVHGPNILHIATHGFFLQNDPRVRKLPQTRTADDTRLGKVVANIENPLLRSGLALAGANQGRSEDDDGVLTALEASALDLWGTRLVVLSACDTGVGEVKSGEGVYGLRRALVLAGAESQVMSLWPVSDRSTRDLMIGYYKGLAQNEGRGDALRRVQLQMLRNKTREHPYYWASFILAGEWANLNGQRDK